MDDVEPIQPPKQVILSAAAPGKQVMAYVDAGGAQLCIPYNGIRVTELRVLLSLAQLDLLAAEVRDRQRILKLATGITE